MFSLNENLNYYLYPGYIPMGKGLESLSELLRDMPDCNLFGGDVFLFFGKKRDTVKLLRWDKDGFILYQKRLEIGSFELPRFRKDRGLLQLQWETFFLMMRGIPLRKIAFRKRFKYQL